MWTVISSIHSSVVTQPLYLVRYFGAEPTVRVYLRNQQDRWWTAKDRPKASLSCICTKQRTLIDIVDDTGLEIQAYIYAVIDEKGNAFIIVNSAVGLWTDLSLLHSTTN